MIVGINSGGFPAGDVKACVPSVRLSQTEISLAHFQDHWNAGCKVLVDYAGPFNSGGVQALNASSVANNALAWYRANTDVTRSPWVEILNEPAIPGSGWGSGAFSQTNATAYRNLVTVFSQTFRNALGANCPAILASYDGGRSSDPTGWGRMWWNSTVAAFVDGITMHSYDQGGNSPSTSFSRISAGHADTNKPVYVTELGWSTTSFGSVTGVSEATQAANIGTMAQKLNDAGWCALWTYFNYRDFSGGNSWGVTKSDGTHKQSYAALHQAFLTYDSGVVTPPASNFTMILKPGDSSKVQVTQVPAGTQRIHVAVAQDNQATNILYGTLGGPIVDAVAPFSFPVEFTPPADRPFIQGQAWDTTDVNTETDLSTWSPWVQTTPQAGTSVPTATTDAASVSGRTVTYNGHADAHGVSGAKFRFERAPLIGGSPDVSQIVAIPSPDVFVGDVAATLAFSAEQHGSVNSGTSFSIGATGLADGLFLLAPIIAKGIGAAQSTITPGSGYSAVTSGDQQFTNASAGAHRLSLFKKVASSEASTTWTLSQSGNHAGASLAFDGVDGTTPVGAVAFQTNASGQTCVCPSVTATAGQVLVTIAAFTNGDSATPPTTTPVTTERVDTQSGAAATDVTLVVDTQAVTSSGATGTRTITFAGANGSDTSCGCSVLLSPAASGGGSTNKAITWVENNVPVGTWADRAVVTSTGGTNAGLWGQFSIAGAPLITLGPVTGVTDTTADISAHIDPLGLSTVWRLEVSTDDGATWTTAIPDSAPFTTPQDV